ncbi:MAG: Rha family transcriptional regulator [Cytophagales bacterium]|nr:Rha family transcriptional regulator [Cytophagales bacterium]
MSINNKYVPRIIEVENIPMTTSLAVAEHFEKEHKHVLRDIRAKIANINNADFCKQHFVPFQHIDSYGRSQPIYRLTESGFAFVVMGFTGQKADQWQCAYIETFNKMREQIKKGLQLDLINKDYAIDYERRKIQSLRMNPKIVDGADTPVKPKPKPFWTQHFSCFRVSGWNSSPNQQNVWNLPLLQPWTTPQLLFVSQLNSLSEINDVKVRGVPRHQYKVFLPVSQKALTQLSTSDEIKIGIRQQLVAKVTGVFKNAPMLFIGKMPKGRYQASTIFAWRAQSMFTSWTPCSLGHVNSIKFTTKFCNVFTRADSPWLKRVQCNFHGKSSRKSGLLLVGVRSSCQLSRTPTSYPERISHPLQNHPQTSIFIGANLCV